MIRWALLPVVALALLALAKAPSASAEPVISSVEIDAPGNLTVGDPFHLIIKLETIDDTEIGFAPGSLPLELELLEAPDPKTRSLGGGRIEVTIDLEIAAFVPGDLIIPPIELAYEEPDGASGTITTPSSRVLVTSVLPADGGQLQVRDLKPQLEIGKASLVMYFLGGLAAILLTLLVVLALLWRATRPRPVPVPAVVMSELGAEDRARTHLAAAGEAFAHDRDFVAYYGVIAVTIRNYLTERYGFHAFALTTVELQEEMARRGIDRWQARLVNGLLTQCDAAVYARYVPALERADHDLTAAFEIVEMSRPEPEPTELPKREEATIP